MDRFEMFLNKCLDGNLCTIESFLSEGVSPDTQNAEGETALQISAANGYLNIVKFLLKKGATVDLPNNYGWTPLMHAARYGHVEVVSHLIQMKAKINVTNRLGLRPVDLAAWSGNFLCLKLIMDAGAIIMVQNDTCDISPLMTVSLHGDDVITKNLLEKGLDVNQASSITGLTPLMLAAYGGHKSIVEVLIEFGADPNKVDICGRTALDLATLEFREDVVILLEDLTELFSRKLSGGISHDINILRVVRNGDMEQMKPLLQINPSLANYSDPKDGVTPLMAACMLGFNNIVELLILNGADLNDQDITNGWTPLMYAVFHRQTETVRLLLEKGADIDICTANGYTAFDLAVHTDTSENNILNMLLACMEADELLHVADSLENSPCSTIKQSHLTVEKAVSRNESQQRFKELRDGFSSHRRQISKSSATSPIPDMEMFDETLYDVFLEKDAQDESPSKNSLCLSKFYSPDEHFAHLRKGKYSEAVYLPPLPCPDSTEEDNQHSNSLRVPNIIKHMRKVSPALFSDIDGEDVFSGSLNVQNDFFMKSDADLSSSLQLRQNFKLKEKNSEAAGSSSECSTLKNFSDLSQDHYKEFAELNYEEPRVKTYRVIGTPEEGLTTLLCKESLQKYAKNFREQEIDVECFRYLTKQDLEEMGIVSCDSRLKLMDIIDHLKK